MSQKPEHITQAQAIRAAKLRRALSEHVRRRGRFLGNVIRRITDAVGRLAQPCKLWTEDRGPLIKTMPSVHSRTCRMGLGLAGGGGGSPGAGSLLKT